MLNVNPTLRTDSVKLIDKYRPRTLSDLEGQSWNIHQLELWLENPHSAAFIFAGPTGTGKTSAALALARRQARRAKAVQHGR